MKKFIYWMPLYPIIGFLFVLSQCIINPNRYSIENCLSTRKHIYITFWPVIIIQEISLLFFAFKLLNII